MTDDCKTVTSTLATQMYTVYHEDDWFGGLLLHVRDVSAAHASRPNPGGTSSAAGQVGHVLYWLRVGRRRLAGEKAQGDQDASFTHMTVTEAQWKQLRAELEAEVSAYQQDIQNIDTWDSEKLTMVLNQLTHAAYHAGSVIQILKATA